MEDSGLPSADASRIDAAVVDGSIDNDAWLADASATDRQAADLSAARDRSLRDGAFPDSVEPDSDTFDSGDPDTGNPDTGNPDTGNPDTGNPDADSPDTASPDTASADTASADTGSPDTASPDTGEPCGPADLSVRHGVADLRGVTTLLSHGDGFVAVNAVGLLGQMAALRADAQGTLDWSRTYSRPAGARKDAVGGGVVLPNQDIALVGGRQDLDDRMHGLIVRADPDGAEVWQSHYTEGSYSTLLYSAVAAAGGLATAGTAYHVDGILAGVWFLRVDSEGNRLNSCVLSFPPDQNSYVWPVIQVRAAGGYWIAAGVANHLGEHELWLYEVADDCVGTVKHVYPFASEAVVRGLFERGADEVAILGDHGGAFMLVTDSAGNETARYSIDGFSPYGVALLADGGFVATGRDRVSLLRASATGAELWRHTYGDHRYDEGRGIAALEGGGFIVAALAHRSILSAGEDAVWLFTTDADGEVSHCCGDGVCALGLGEDCDSCAEDCGACAGTCCNDRSSPGCSDRDVQECVCDYDDGCCETRWHVLCAAWVEDRGCGLCPPE